MGPITAMIVNMFSILIFLPMKDPLNYINITYKHRNNKAS